MTISKGASILLLALCLTASPLRAESQLSPKLKEQLSATVAGAKTVPLKETAATPAAPLKNIDAVDEKDLEDLDPIPSSPSVAPDAAEIEPLKLSLDKPEIIRLDRDAVNVIVGSNENLRVVPDTNKSLVLIAKKPGSTYFRALDVDGKVIMQRHVIIGSPTKNYIRIRRACANGAAGCKQYSVYYCPDMCHEVNVVQDATAGGASTAIPEETPAGVQGGSANAAPVPASATPATPEPPPGE